MHWTAWGISPRSRGLAAGARPPSQGRNDFGRLGYGGPCPPRGTKHRYVFRLYALDRPLPLRAGAAPGRFLRTLGSAGAFARIELVGTYHRAG